MILGAPVLAGSSTQFHLLHGTRADRIVGIDQAEPRGVGSNSRTDTRKQNQPLPEENARLKQVNEVLAQERGEELEGSLEKSMQAPLKPDDLETRASELFYQLILQSESVVNGWGDSEIWFRQLQGALAECPNIAKAAILHENPDPVAATITFLLQMACEHISEYCRAADDTGPNDPPPPLAIFQMLVKVCPSALLWDYSDGSQKAYGQSVTCIDAIAGGFGLSHPSC